MAYNNRGTAFHYKGEYGQAISDYNKAVEIDPEYALAYFNRGVAHFKKGDYEKAWEDVLRVQMLGYRVSPEFLEQLRNAFEKSEYDAELKLWPCNRLSRNARNIGSLYRFRYEVPIQRLV
jgi:tetratricopeptide (TPR) repeat protein